MYSQEKTKFSFNFSYLQYIHSYVNKIGVGVVILAVNEYLFFLFQHIKNIIIIKVGILFCA